jgi:ABC-type transport system involved in multi-copper enzyme maturation permease subunit
MYFWKYWRDTRRGVFVYLGVLIVFAAFWLFQMSRPDTRQKLGGDPTMLWAMDVSITIGLSYLCALVMGFTTGSNSAGADIGNGTGDFLLTRPRPRKYFVWAGWIAGIAEIFALIAFTALAVFASATWATGPVWRQISDPSHFGFDDQHIAHLPLVFAMVLLTAAVVFGLTYSLTIFFRNGQRGVIVSLAILFGYSIGSSILKAWAGISLPTLNLDNSSFGPNSPWYQSPLLHIVGWTLVALAFPVAAQVIFERKDV